MERRRKPRISYPTTNNPTNEPPFAGTPSLSEDSSSAKERVDEENVKVEYFQTLDDLKRILNLLFVWDCVKKSQYFHQINLPRLLDRVLEGVKADLLSDEERLWEHFNQYRRYYKVMDDKAFVCAKRALLEVVEKPETFINSESSKWGWACELRDKNNDKIRYFKTAVKLLEKKKNDILAHLPELEAKRKMLDDKKKNITGGGIPEEKTGDATVKIAETKKFKATSLPPMPILGIELVCVALPEREFKKDEKHICEVVTYEGFDNFHICLKDENTSALPIEVFQEKMRAHPDYIKAIEACGLGASNVPNVEDYILAKDGEDYERAKVISIKGSTAMVKLIDLGKDGTVPVNNCRKIPSTLLRQSAALAVPCRLQPGKLLKDREASKEVMKTIFDSMPRRMKVIFHERVTGPNGLDKIWQVSLKFQEREDGRWISMRGEVQRALGGRANAHIGDSDDSDDPEEFFQYYLVP